MFRENVRIGVDHEVLEGTLAVPENATGVVLFAHGSGSSRLSPRNQSVAEKLNQAGLATLLFDLLSPEEAEDRSYVFDIPLLGERLEAATRWVRKREDLFALPVGYFGASTGGAAALWAAASLGKDIAAVVSRGGRPDLAMAQLGQVSAPTLLLVGGEDGVVLELNRKALNELPRGRLVIIPGATHLFEERGAMDEVAREATAWFVKNFSEKVKHAVA